MPLTEVPSGGGNGGAGGILCITTN